MPIPARPSDAIAKQHEREQLVTWLLRFSETDCRSKGSATNWRALQDELDRMAWVLVGHGKVYPDTWLLPRTKAAKANHIAEWQSFARFRRHLPALTRTQILSLHARLRALLVELWPKDLDPQDFHVSAVSVPTAVRRVVLQHTRAADSAISRTSIVRVFGVPWRHLHWWAIAVLLEEFGAQLERCTVPTKTDAAHRSQFRGQRLIPAPPTCGRLFLRIRRQQYCSAQCAQRARSRKFYATHPEQAKATRRTSYYRKKARVISGEPVVPTAEHLAAQTDGRGHDGEIR